MLNEAITSSPVIVFTGAGASQPLGFPIMQSFMDGLEDIVRNDPHEFPVLQNIYTQYRLPDGEPGRDLEKLLQALTRYQDAFRLMAEDPNFQRPMPYSSPALKAITEGIAGPSLPDTVQSLDDKTRDLIFQEYGKDVSEDKDVVELYQPLLGTIAELAHHPVIPVFTTNYDRAIEIFADQTSVSVEYGFRPGHARSVWNPQRFHKYEAPSDGYGVVLFKLHGSVTWYKVDGAVRTVSAAQRGLSGWENMLIYPGDTKTGVLEEPYHTCFSYLRHCLYHASCCLVIGYSFRDLFIQRVFQEAADINPQLRVLVMNGTDHRTVASQIEELRPEAKTLLHRFEAGVSASYLPDLRNRLAAFLPKVRLVPISNAPSQGEPH